MTVHPFKVDNPPAKGHAMNTVYACTHVEKCAEEDHYENGCDPSTQVCVMHERCNVQADSLPGLLKALGKQFYLNIDDVFVPDDDENGNIARIGYNRLEDVDGNQPTADQERRWKAGKQKLYLADYAFIIEQRNVSPIRLEEFQANSIRFHA
jgi:hypothetical protein